MKNSNMFAREQKQEYDPTSLPVIERPLAKVQGNAYGASGLEGLRSADRGRPFSHQRTDSKNIIPIYSPTKTPLQASVSGLRSPSKDQVSPTKSSLSSRYFNGKISSNSAESAFSEDQGDDIQLPPGRALHRHAKSVTFDAAPPQVNEYEMTTPDISSIGNSSRENSYDSVEEEDSYNLGDSMEQDDSFDDSLEDTDKTPVVGPEDWRHASPGAHNSGFTSGRFDDPFEGPEGSPMPDARPSSSHSRPGAVRNDSLTSNGDHRPLPPLPGMSNRRNSNSSMASPSQRSFPSPLAPSPVSKAEILGLSGGNMSLEEKLRLMMIQDEEKPKTTAELQRERRMRRARSSQTPEREQTIAIHEDEDTLDDLPGLGNFELPQKISRESILRKINGQDTFGRESDYNFSSPMPSSSPERPAALDPDTPLPTTEDRSMLENEVLDDDDSSVIIKPELEDDDDIDVYDIPEMYHHPSDHDLKASLREDSESAYSDLELPSHHPQSVSRDYSEDAGTTTPRQASPTIEKEEVSEPAKLESKASLPAFTGFLGNTDFTLNNNDFGLSMQSYMTPSPPQILEDPFQDKPILAPPKQQRRGPRMSDAHEFLRRSDTPEEDPEEQEQGEQEEEQAELEEQQSEERHAVPRISTSRPEYDGTGWGSDEDEEFEVGTPESVIHHQLPPSPPRDSPSIPEQIATIKSSGSKLKTRPSATPSDLMAMREARRIVSGDAPSIPPIPDRHRNRPSLNMERESSETVSAAGDLERNSSFSKKALTLDIGSDLGSSLYQDFDRVIEAQKVAFDLSSSHSAYFLNLNGQASNSNDEPNHVINANISPRKQRGYLMRQNTKVVVGNDRGDEFHGARSAGNSPIKKERPQSWTVEPWNGHQRQASYRDKSNPRKKPVPGAVPPMPGQESNATGLGMVSEETSSTDNAEEGERGRLFVKVIGVKDLDLPLPRSKIIHPHDDTSTDPITDEQSWFSLTLDNGVHCVTTAWLELGRNAPIGQEFELVVPNELEFQLTLNAKLVKPAPRRVVESPTKTHKAQKPSTFSRVFMSPKKRKELELMNKEEEQRAVEQKKRDAATKRASQLPTTWDLLSPLAAEDGSFGRAYICLKDHETRCFGRPYVVDVACFNEWATEEASHSSSMMSKRGNTVVQRRAPYKVGNLELQLLFVPKPKTATDDDMPKSMNSCIREMKEAEVASARNWEGYLSQQGGDCPVSFSSSYHSAYTNSS